MPPVLGGTTEVAYVAAFGLASLACLVTLVRARRVADDATRRGFVGVLVGAAGWSGSHAGLFVAPTPGLKYGSYMFGLILGFSTVFSWLYFCSAYTGRNYHRRPRLRLAALGLYLGVVAVKLTNPIHGQYFSATVVTEPFRHLAIQQGVLHWAAAGLSYTLAAVGLFMLFELFAEAGYDTRSLSGLTAVTALPVGLDLVGFTSDALLNVIYAPLGVAVFAVGVLYVYQERFLAVQLTGDVDDPVVFLDDDGRVRDYNRTAERIFPDLAGGHGEQLRSVLPVDPGPAGRGEGDGERTEAVVAADVDGDRRYYLASGSSFALGQADLGRVVLFSDVTHIERQRRELERHNDQLEEFAAGIRHELRNSLQVIRGHVEAAGDALDGGDVTRARQSLGTASDTTTGMARTVSDLATLAQYGQTVGGTSAVDFREIVEAAWSNADTGGLSLTVAGEGTVEAEAARLRTLFERTFRFAALNDATAVRVTLRADGFAVEDDGERPDTDSLPALFDYGDAVPNSEAGMALPTARTLARVHGWSMTVDGDYREGVRVVVSGATVSQRESPVS